MKASIMSFIRRWIVALLMIVIGISAYGFVFGWHRPYVNWAPWELAEYLVKNQRPVAECNDLLYLEIMAPSQAEQRALCVHEYAKIAKDPSACELLMPSSYGLSCVGGAQDFDPCVMLADSGKSVGGKGIETTYDRCLNGSQTTQNHVCCRMAKVLYGQEKECTSFPTGELSDQCHHILGVKNKEINECAKIANPRNRTGCEVIVRAYLNGLSLQ